MKKICTIVGARPQFIKAAALSRSLAAANDEADQTFAEIIVHTGQHYDPNLSASFFEELRIPEPRYHLGIGSGSHGAQTGAMLTAVESVLSSEDPDLAIVFGDTNSTLAGALAAAKRSIPLAHVEAGVRSFNRSMPEEINRVVTDHVSNLLFCPSEVAVANLRAEGITRGIHFVGDVMLDVLLSRIDVARTDRSWLQDLGLEEGRFVLATLHRSGNTDSRERLSGAIGGLSLIAEEECPVVLPLHPRTNQRLREFGIEPVSLLIVDPLPYSAMLSLQAHAACVVTDSGGMQKEAFWLETPCVTLRDDTEWVETVEAGWNRLVAPEAEAMLFAVRLSPPATRPDLYGDGSAGAQIASILERELGGDDDARGAVGSDTAV